MDSSYINNELNCDFLRISTSPIDTKFRNKYKLINLIRIISSLLFLLKSNRYDKVYCTVTASGAAIIKDYVILKIIRFFNREVILHFHNKGFEATKLPSSLKKKYIGDSNVILLSPALYDDFVPYLNKNKVFYLANGLNTRIVHETSLTKRCVNEPIRLVFLSNLIKTKGVFEILEACLFLKNKSIDFECHFIGPFYDVGKSEFLDYINEKDLEQTVIYHGALYGSDKLEVLSKGHVLLFPTYYPNECFPLVIIEAFSLGIPVISTNEGAIGSMVKDNFNGFIVKKKDSIGLARSVERLYSNEELRYNMSIHALKEYKKKYTVGKFEYSFVDIIIKSNKYE